MPTDFSPKPFRCAVAERDGAVLVRPAGELDMRCTGDDRIHRLFELTAMEPLFTFVDG